MKLIISQRELHLLVYGFAKAYQKSSGIKTIVRKSGSNIINVFFKSVRYVCIRFKTDFQCDIIVFNHQHLSKSTKIDLKFFDADIYYKNEKYYSPKSDFDIFYDSFEEILYWELFYSLEVWLLMNIHPNSYGIIKDYYDGNNKLKGSEGFIFHKTIGAKKL